MDSFTKVIGAAAPLMRQNVDTDVIIRIERLMGRGRDDLAPFAFEVWRNCPDGTPDRDFVLNRPSFSNAKILLAGANFGCGSSREGAVWALQCLGYRCVIAPSFGDIFYGNCFQNGVLPIVLPVEVIDGFARKAWDAPDEDFEVDLTTNTIRTPDGVIVPFEVELLRRQMLLDGLDELGLTLRRSAQIDAFQERDRALRPWIYLAGA